MKPEFEILPLVKNDNPTRFELTVDGYTAFIDYREKPQEIALIHTESPEELAGRGVATALIEKTLIYLKENEITLAPYCPLVFAYLKKHPEWQTIVRTDFLEKLKK